MPLDTSALSSATHTLGDVAKRIEAMAEAQAGEATARGEEVGTELVEIQRLLDTAVRRLQRLQRSL